jgi:hypothetical protein
MEINKVYLHGKKLYLIVNKFKRSNKTIYMAKRVFPNESLGPKCRLRYKKGCFKLQKNIKVETRVVLPKAQRELVRYLSVVDRAIGQVETLEALNWRSNGIKMKIAELAWASCYYYNAEKGRYYNIRDFAYELGFEKASRIYPWIKKYLESLFVEGKYIKEIPDCADRTLVSQVNAYAERWKCYHGYSKAIDALIEHDLKSYTKEIYKRGLNAYVEKVDV